MMTKEEKDLFEEIWKQFRLCLVHATATPKLINSWEEKIRKVLK